MGIRVALNSHAYMCVFKRDVVECYMEDKRFVGHVYFGQMVDRAELALGWRSLQWRRQRSHNCGPV